MSADNFYTRLRPFSDFSQLGDSRFFEAAPPAWHVLITDVQGSTVLIKEGRYKDVNLIGAASITCALNALKDETAIPFVFGGDGATLLIPEMYLDLVRGQLVALQGLAQREFGITLRVGHVSIRRLYELGATVSVGKYELSSGNYTAQFHGTGLTLAEAMIKKGHPAGATVLEANEQSTPPNVTGLSCRLEPISSRFGRMLSILVKPKGTPHQQLDVLKSVLDEFKGVFGGDFRSANPVSREMLRWTFPPDSLAAEVRLQKQGRSVYWQWFKSSLRVFFSRLLLTYNVPIGAFNPVRYKSELVLNSDFKKYDETLRMVIDCDEAQEQALRAILVRHRNSGELSFGIHASQNAIMTCMVFSASHNKHIHFIDGGDGGYALAAMELKAELARRDQAS